MLRSVSFSEYCVPVSHASGPATHTESTHEHHEAARRIERVATACDRDRQRATCARDGVDRTLVRRELLTSVDPEWVSEQHGPTQQRALGRGAERFVPPVSPEDAAARVLDPMLSTLSGAPLVWGVVLRNFRPVAW
jgi:hypothetical protein